MAQFLFPQPHVVGAGPRLVLGGFPASFRYGGPASIHSQLLKLQEICRIKGILFVKPNKAEDEQKEVVTEGGALAYLEEIERIADIWRIQTATFETNGVETPTTISEQIEVLLHQLEQERPLSPLELLQQQPPPPEATEHEGSEQEEED